MFKINMLIRFIIHNLILLKKYNFKGDAIPNSIVYHIDGSRLNMGLADRFRQILGVYALAKKHHKIFKIKMTAPFDIEEYLEPNLYNWKIDNQFLSFNLMKVRLFYVGYFSKKHTQKIITKSRKQVYVYSSAHYSWIFDFGYSYKELFNELFKPSHIISSIVENYINQYHCWDTLHFRFIGLLNDFNEKNDMILSRNEKEELIHRCEDFLVLYLKENNKNVLVSSDSVTFQNLVKDIPGVITVPGTPKHLDYTSELNDKNYQKEFLDFFLISKSDKVISVFTPEMYKSDFPNFAASINDVSFNRVQI